MSFTAPSARPPSISLHRKHREHSAATNMARRSIDVMGHATNEAVDRHNVLPAAEAAIEAVKQLLSD